MPTLPNMNLITPTLGGDSGQWDDKINAALGLVDAHDHTSGKGVAIRTAAISIDADLSFGGFTLTNLGKIAFTAIAAPVAGSKNLFVNTADNELYWRSNAGTNVQLTSGASINTTLVGGIVGDYSTVGAEVAYDDANDRYTFKQQGTKPWARLASGPVRIYEFNTTETVYVEHAIDATLATSYTVTWPAAVPGATSLVQISAAGAVSFSNTLSVGSITAQDFRYTAEQPFILPVSLSTNPAGGHTRGNNKWVLAASANQIVWPIPVRSGDVITGFTVYVDKNTNSGATIAARLYKTSGETGTETALGTGDTDNQNAPNFILLTESPAISETVNDQHQYYLVFTPSGSVTPAADDLYHAVVNVKRP